ncbi:hypothetical protein ACSNOI_04170 [Actinomadura kijaniata]|uniref:hypothetical protein n=1 Tax=Actinomadura kijaniata TaxID=46161 RepID=UPI003F1D2607
MLLVSVAWQVAAHAPGPMVVVRGEEPVHYGEIVVGADGSGWGARLRAVLAWARPMPAGPGRIQPPVYDPESNGPALRDQSPGRGDALARHP